MEYAQKGTPGATPVVLVHGWPDSWVSFRPVMEALPDAIHAIAVSLPGFGGSDALRGHASPDQLAEAVIAAIEQLQISPAVLVGHSLGTLVSQRVAAVRPDLVRGVVLIGGFSTLSTDVADEIWGVVSQLVDPIDEAFVREFQSSTLAVPVSEAFFETLVAESLRAPAAVWRSTFAGIRATNYREQLARVAAPTLIIWGDQDALIPRAEQEVLVGTIPHARLEVYEAAGHSPNWEQPGRIGADIVAFVDRLDAADVT
jgi:pimeloyl-ACP methyl ester carboxylesterase